MTSARLLGLALAATVAACSSSTDNSNPPPTTANVTATTGLAFSPKNVQVAAGGTVTWIFQSVGHNVTFTAAAGAPADIPGVNSNTSIGRTFPTAGTYSYHCTIHPSMTGTVQVVSAATQVAGGTNDPPPVY